MNESELGLFALGVVLVAASIRMWLLVRRTRAEGELEDHRRSGKPGANLKQSRKDSEKAGDSPFAKGRAGRPGRIRRSIPSIIGGVAQGLLVLLFLWLVVHVLFS